VKILIVSVFNDKWSTIHGLTSGLDAYGCEWNKIDVKASEVPIGTPAFADYVAKKAEKFDTVLIGKGTLIPMGVYKALVDKCPDVTYLTFDSVSGEGCGPPGRPAEVGQRGLLCTRIYCTGTEGARWYRQHGYKGRIAQIYQGCRHSIWRPQNLDRSRTGKPQLCFLGSINYAGDGGRKAKVQALAGKGFKVQVGRGIFHEAASKLYYDSAISLNFVCGTPGEGSSPVGITSNRLVRILTSGGFALTERNSDVDASFEDGNQVAMFDHGNAEQLVERVRYYLDNPKDRLEIARRGWEWSQNWGWGQQMEKMVRFIDGVDIPADGAAGDYVGTYKDDSGNS